MRKYIHIIAILLGVLFSLSSCKLMNSIDRIKPEHKLMDGNVIIDTKSAELALNGVYVTWRNHSIPVFRTHSAILSGAVQKTGLIGGESGFPTNDVRQDNSAIEGLYRALYGTLNSANFVIEVLKKGDAVGLESPRLEEMIAEAKFHRASAHLMLLSFFGEFWNMESKYGIVLREVPYRETSIAPREKVEKCYQSIVKDLEYTIEYAPQQPLSHAYVSSLAAKGMLARTLLQMRDYAKAATIAKEVIEEAPTMGFELVEGEKWKEMFVEGWESSEGLFALYTYGFEEECATQIDRTAAGSYTKKLANYWGEQMGENEDPRFKMVYTESTGSNNMDKYPYGSNVGVTGNGYFMIRLAELYYIHAECAARGGDYGAARNTLSTILARVGYPESVVDAITESELIEVIRQHKWLELFAENHLEWFDMVRYQIEGDIDISDIKTTIISNYQLMLPIPEKALIANKLLIPNPGQQVAE